VGEFLSFCAAKKVRIIYYCDWFEEYTASLAMSVANLSHSVTLVARSQSPEFRLRRSDEAELHNELIESTVDLELLAGKYFSVKSMIHVHNMYRRKRNAGYGCFHLQQTGDPRFLWMVVRLPSILTLHEPASRSGVSSGAGRLRDFSATRIERLYRYFAKLIIVHTNVSFEMLTPAEKQKAIVIPHGVHERRISSQCDTKTILFFGRAAAYKGIDILLAAMTEVWKSVPDARLRILASPGDYEPTLDGMDSRIVASWDGYSTRELEHALATSRAVCLPYISASGSGVGAQALGSGIPIVASDLEGLRELVADRGLLAEPGSVADLARALVLILRTDGGTRVVDPARVWPAVAATHVSAYESMLSRVANW